MSAITKSQSIVRALQFALTERLPSTYIITQSLDNAGARLFIQQSSSWASGQDQVVIRVTTETTQFNDVIGNPQQVYSPMKGQMISEGTTSPTPTASVLTLKTMAAVLNELCRSLGRIELYLTALATQPTTAELNSDGTVSGATLVQTLQTDVRWPLSGQ